MPVVPNFLCLSKYFLPLSFWYVLIDSYFNMLYIYSYLCSRKHLSLGISVAPFPEGIKVVYEIVGHLFNTLKGEHYQ